MYDAVTIFRPAYWRCLLTSGLTGLLVVLTVVLVSLAVNTNVTLRLITSGPFIFIAVCFFVGRALGTARVQQHLTIAVSLDSISGPSAWAGRRISFPRALLDPARSCTPTVLQRIGGYRYLWSTDGHKIGVNAWALGQAEVSRLFTHVGCSTESGAR
jgi:hypothetical protein